MKTPVGKVGTRSAVLGLRPGIDPDRMNQLADEFEAEGFLAKQSRKTG
ncbi:MAG: hypothetical protein IT582_11395 [Opitutaceae bacterium]|nr:hypothetical protein [Opitutaceae bacterium]